MVMESERKKSPVQVEYGPVLFEYRLMREFVLLQEQNLSNIYVVPSHSSPLKWFGVLFVHDGLYQGAIFRFTVHIPAKFPSAASPDIVFDPIPFHPLVNPKTGNLKTSLSIPEWDPHTNKIWQLVLYAKKVFYSLEMDVHLLKDNLKNRKNGRAEDFNYDAVKLFFDDLEGFQAKVSESVQESRVKMYDPPEDADDRNAILFDAWNPETHEPTRRAFLSGRCPEQLDSQSVVAPTAGLSWVQTTPAAHFQSFT